MGQLLFYYQRPEPSTWVYLSSFLIIGVYFMFHRVWSLRNLDLVLILLLTPGLMMIYEGRKKERLSAANPTVLDSVPSLAVSSPPTDRHAFDPPGRFVSIPQDPPQVASQATIAVVPQPDLWPGRRLQFWGFVWLLGVCGLLLARMLLDTALVRRPLLEPNLSSGGLSFISASLFLFLMANILTSTPEEQRRAATRLGPGYVLLNMLPAIQTVPQEELPQLAKATTPESTLDPQGMVPVSLQNTAKVFAVVANSLLVLGMVAIGYWHFGNMKTGIGAATMMLLLPYMAQMNGRVDHVLPGALLILAILGYRQPILSGIMLGCAAGLVYYPFFLLPLWLSFYWQRGVRRFTIGFLSALGGLMIALAFYGPSSLLEHLVQMYGVFKPATDGLGGVWGLGWYPQFRLPLLVLFVMFCFSFVAWPAQKNLATLMSCSAAIMTAAQFWHGYGGGLYMAWFVPLILLTVFRPNLDDRVALSVVRPAGKRSRKVSDENQDGRSPLAQAG